MPKTLLLFTILLLIWLPVYSELDSTFVNDGKLHYPPNPSFYFTPKEQLIQLLSDSETISHRIFDDVYIEKAPTKVIGVDNCFFSYLTIDHFYSPYLFDFSRSVIYNLYLERLKCDALTFESDTFLFSYKVWYSNFSSLHINYNLFLSSTEPITFVYDTIGQFDFIGNTRSSLDFVRCQFCGETNFHWGDKSKDSIAHYRKVRLLDCHVLPQTVLDFSLFDTIVIGLGTIDGNITIGPNSGRKYIDIEQVNKLENIYFEVSDSTIFIFDQKSSWNDTCSTYDALFEKFKKEGRKISLQNLDIRFKEIEYRHNGQEFLNTIQKYWWNYGYDRERIFTNTLFFLLIFSFINFIFWDSIQKVYSYENVILVKFRFYKRFKFVNYLDGKNSLESIRNIYNVFVYTCIVFFILKIDLNRLSFKRPLPLLVFFVEYLTGIICIGYMIGLIIQKIN